MKICFIGDIVGKPGRRSVARLLPSLIGNYGIDIVIANCENAAGGFGVTFDVVKELLEHHIHVLTSGNHIWDKKEVMDFIEDCEFLLRPANYPQNTPGRGSAVITSNTGLPVGILNLEGRVFMKNIDCPFQIADKEIEKLKNFTDIIIVDFHAEATSEKQALGWYLDGRVSAVLGTHTHVQTADDRILPGGTAYCSDVGMSGARDSVLGMKKNLAIERFLKALPNKLDVAKKDVWFQGVVLDIDEKTGKSTGIERISLPMN